MPFAEPLSALSLNADSPSAYPPVTKTGALAQEIDCMISSIDMSRIEALSFHVNDIPYHVSHTRNTSDGESTICVHAVLGYVPFSAESVENRHAVLTILSSTRSLLHVRFGVDHYGKLFAAGNFTTDMLKAPDFIFHPLTLFLQEAQPFINLIGRYLGKRF